MSVPRPEFGDRFLPLRQLGAGGTAETWLVEDRRSGATRVAKVLPEGTHRQGGDSLRREFAIGRRLDHPNIVRTVGLYGDDDEPLLVLEYVPGTDIGAVIGRPIEEAVRVLRDVACALKYMHQRGIVHRDLKPSNILLDAAGRPHIADFGVADMVEPDGTLPRLVGGGSRPWIGPQQLDGAAATVGDDLYSFGAVIQHVVTGSPPLGLNPSEEQIRTADPQPLIGPLPVPPQLSELVSALLAKAPHERPQDMAAVISVLDTVLSDTEGLTSSSECRPAPDRPNISPPPRPPDIRTGPAGSHGVEGSPSRTTTGLPFGWSTAGAIALLVAILAFVIFVLPGVVERRTTQVEDPANAGVLPRAVSAAEQRTEPEARDPAAVAEEARTRYAEQRQRAESLGAPVWARADYLNATGRGETAEAMYAASRFEEAGAAYAEAAAQMARVIERRQEVVDAAISDGDDALENGDIAGAVEAYNRALTIAPDEARARGGLRRAQVRPQVLALLDRGARSERMGDHAAAADHYRSALRLDPDVVEARAGADRADRAKARGAFSAAMSEGLAALDDNRFADARSAFRKAGELEPDAPEVREALQRVDRVERRRNLANLKRMAEEAEALEDWRTAADLYDRVLALDSNLAFAMSGKDRSANRLELSSRIEFHLAHPERLVSDDVLADADAVLAAALDTEPRGPVIDRQTQLLEKLVTTHSTVVPVLFRSDNLTDVIIHRVGRLGSFASKTLELRPGTYTVVGSRPGYRDVRIQLTVQPGVTVAPVVVLCEEAV